MHMSPRSSDHWPTQELLVNLRASQAETRWLSGAGKFRIKKRMIAGGLVHPQLVVPSEQPYCSFANDFWTSQDHLSRLVNPDGSLSSQKHPLLQEGMLVDRFVFPRCSTTSPALGEFTIYRRLTVCDEKPCLDGARELKIVLGREWMPLQAWGRGPCV